MGFMLNNTPLAVDLDGTLVLTDTLYESVIKLVTSNPFSVLLLPFWLARGKAYLKQQVGARAIPEPALLPYNQPLLDWLKQEKARGRHLTLCTASDEAVARSVSEHTGLFDELIASDGSRNIKGRVKLEALKQRFGDHGFSYAGDSTADLAVWEHANSAVTAVSSEQLTERVKASCQIEKSFPRETNSLADILRLLRVHQWAKNSLLFAPALAAHQLDLTTLSTLMVAFVAFSLCASSIYIFNDLIDLESDRRHPRKKLRPLAEGSVSMLAGLALAPTLLGVSVVIASQLNSSFIIALGFYLVLTLTYSLLLKRVVLLDCITLASLYTLRVIAGAAAISNTISFWLLAFSVFLFLSLAFVKRFIELKEASRASLEMGLPGRGYHPEDSGFVLSLGIATGMMSVMVFALYIDSTASEELYLTPELVWVAVAVFQYWVSWIWLKAYRGEMHDDPVVFAITDRVSLLSGAIFVSAIFLGTMSFRL